MGRRLRRSQPKPAKEGEPLKLYPREVFKPLDPDKPLAPYRVPPLKPFDRHMPGQLTLEDVGVIRVPEDQ
jgi:hypothetical protein